MRQYVNFYLLYARFTLYAHLRLDTMKLFGCIILLRSIISSALQLFNKKRDGSLNFLLDLVGK